MGSSVVKYNNDFQSMKNDVLDEYPMGGGAEGAKSRNKFLNVNEEEDTGDEPLYEIELDDGEEEMGEQTSSGSAGAYVAPLGSDSETFKSNPQRKQFNEEEEMGEQTGSGSAGSYSQPQIWAKNYKNWKAVQDPKFPKWGGPGGTYVRVKKKCNHFPYCNQGDINALEFYEEKTLKEALENVSKKTNKSVSYLKNIILNEIETNVFKKDLNKYRKKKESKYKKSRTYEEELEEVIRRAFYKSPVTDPDAGIVGVTPMNLPIGKYFTFKGNKPKYE
jgi:hypothetical protein